MAEYKDPSMNPACWTLRTAEELEKERKEAEYRHSPEGRIMELEKQLAKTQEALKQTREFMKEMTNLIKSQFQAINRALDALEAPPDGKNLAEEIEQMKANIIELQEGMDQVWNKLEPKKQRTSEPPKWADPDF